MIEKFGLSRLLTRQEYTPSPEILVPQFDVLALYGPSGTGKTTAARTLKNLYGADFIKPAEEFRSRFKKEHGENMIGFAERDVRDDVALDQHTSDLIKSSIFNQRPIILESRLAGFLATQNEELSRIYDEEEASPRVVRVLFTAEFDIQVRRILDRENKEIIRENMRRPEYDQRPLLTYDEVQRKTYERRDGDLAAWSQAHPEMIGDPLDYRDPRTQHLHDLVVHTDNLSVNDAVAAVNDWMIENGHVQKIDPNAPENKPALLPRGLIFSRRHLKQAS